jgi:hypothetical protein
LFHKTIALSKLLFHHCGVFLPIKMERKEAAEKADKLIQFTTPELLPHQIKASRTMLVFFGAAWCSNTQRFNLEYLKVQEQVDSDEKFRDNGFIMRKFECGGKYTDKCLSYPVDGYPTILVYLDGKLKEEYTNENDAASLLKYIEKLIEDYPGTETAAGGATMKLSEFVTYDKQDIGSISLFPDSAMESLNSLPLEIDWFSYLLAVPVILIVFIAITIYRQRKKSQQAFS